MGNRAESFFQAHFSRHQPTHCSPSYGQPYDSRLECLSEQMANIASEQHKLLLIEQATRSKPWNLLSFHIAGKTGGLGPGKVIRAFDSSGIQPYLIRQTNWDRAHTENGSWDRAVSLGDDPRLLKGDEATAAQRSL